MTYAIISLAILGGIFGVVLAFANKRFRVEVDPRVDAITEVLPGANCSACGYPSCGGLADAIVAGKAQVDSCLPGGAAVAGKIAEIMGVEGATEGEERMVAQLMCSGGKENCSEKYEYDGVEDCRAAVAFFSGHKDCRFGCIGLGTCATVCPFGAITMGENRLPIINYEKCTGCMICVNNCPQQVLKAVGGSHLVHVRCLNVEKAKVAKQQCTAVCIKCKICEKNCPQDAIHVVEVPGGSLAVIDYEKCDNCGTCIEKCPTNAISGSPNCLRDNTVEIEKPRKKDIGCQGCPLAGACSR